MLSALWRAVTQPASFFEQEVPERGLRQPAVVVVIVGAFGLLTVAPILQATLSTLPPGGGAFAAIGVTVGVLAGLLGPFIAWVAYAGAFYILSLAFDSTGDFWELFAATGWGFAPRILSSVVGGVVLFVAISGVDFADPAQVQQFQDSFPRSPLGMVNQVVGLVITLWSAWIWTHAVASTRDLGTKQAGIVVGVAVGFGIIVGFVSTFVV